MKPETGRAEVNLELGKERSDRWAENTVKGAFFPGKDQSPLLAAASWNWVTVNLPFASTMPSNSESKLLG